MKEWFDFIEERMGARFRFALEMTLTWTLRVLSVVAFVIFAVADVYCFVEIFLEGISYILRLIFFTILTIVALFVTFWSFGEDW